MLGDLAGATPTPRRKAAEVSCLLQGRYRHQSPSYIFVLTFHHQQIFGLTPRSHADHLGVFSLLHCTEMMIRVLQSVKSREQEYSAIKALAARIQGIPPEFQLARRERRLIAQGPLLRLSLNTPLHGDALISETSYAPALRGRNPSSIKPHNNPPRRANPNHPSTHHAPTESQLESYPGTESSTVAESVYTGAELGTDTLSYDFPLAPDSEASDLSGPLPHGMLPHGDPPMSEQSKWVYVFVFTDIVVLARHRRHVNIRGVTTESWDLLPDVGIARVLGYSDMSGSECEQVFFSIWQATLSLTCAAQMITSLPSNSYPWSILDPFPRSLLPYRFISALPSVSLDGCRLHPLTCCRRPASNGLMLSAAATSIPCDLSPFPLVTTITCEKATMAGSLLSVPQILFCLYCRQIVHCRKVRLHSC